MKIYVNLLLAWQARINLIGPSTVETVWTRHVLDAVQLQPLLPPNTARIADLGTGAGIPGLILSITAGVEAHLYEANSKKVAFLREAIRKTGAKAQVHQIRLEEIGAQGVPPAVDCVVSRALAPLPLLLDYASPFLAGPVTCLFHKGRDVDLELTEATKYWRFQYTKHQSACDSHGVILEVKEVSRV